MHAKEYFFITRHAPMIDTHPYLFLSTSSLSTRSQLSLNSCKSTASLKTWSCQRRGDRPLSQLNQRSDLSNNRRKVFYRRWPSPPSSTGRKIWMRKRSQSLRAWSVETSDRILSHRKSCKISATGQTVSFRMHRKPIQRSSENRQTSSARVK